MSENCSAAKQEIGGASRGFEKLADKIIDRCLPDEPENKIHDWMKGSAIFAGMLLWFLYGLASEWIKGLTVAERPTGTNGKENSNLYESPRFESLGFEWTTPVSGIVFLFLAIIGFFIYKSFNRGRPLTFFFWGLIFPSIALNTLQFAFR